MTEKSALDSLGEGQKRQSTMNLMRSKFDRIEEKRAMDIPMSTIFESMQKDGLTITFAHFKTALVKIRKERGLGRSKKVKESKNQEPAHIATPANSEIKPPVPAAPVQGQLAGGKPAPVKPKPKPAVIDKTDSVGDIKKSLSGKTDFSNFNVD